MRRRPPLPFLFALLASMLAAHPEIEYALARLNVQLAAAPRDPDLLLERGDLYARHDDRVAAEANFLLAAELAPNHPGVARSRGALALAAGDPREARQHLDAALARAPDDPTARLLRARALTALQERGAALADLDAALALVAAPSPELYLQKAALLDPAEAVRFLDEAIARLGPVVSLQLRALALEESLGRIEAAAARYDRLAAQSERKELWLRQKGDLFARTGRAREARTAYAAALAAIAALPDWLRESPETVTLRSQLSSLVPATP
jgi:tetratricopeptide (TPR) repeat protein